MPAAVALLDELAQFAGIRVVEFSPVHLNLPHDSPCHGGFVPTKALADADVGLLVDVDVPWIPKDMPENPSTWWAHVDVDPEKRAIPMWTFPANLRLQGDSCGFYADLLAVLKARADAGFKARAAARVKAIAAEGVGASRAGGQARRRARRRRRDQPAPSLRQAGQGARVRPAW